MSIATSLKRWLDKLRRLFFGHSGVGTAVIPPPPPPPPPPADTTAPTLSLPVGTQTGTTTATVGATTNEANGTLYYVIALTSAPPTAIQVESGQNAAGSAAVVSASQSIGSIGAKTFAATGLTAATTYYAHLMHKDAAGNRSTVVSSASFTTAALGTGPKFVDIDGNANNAPLAGDVLFADIGTAVPAADSYIVQVYDDNGAIIGTSQTFVSGEPIYNVLIADGGHPLHLGVTPVTGGISGTEILSTPTSNVMLPVITPPVITRTSASAAVPFAFTIHYDSTVRAGMTSHLQVINSDDGSILQDLWKEITEDELAGSFNSYWDGTYSPVPGPAALTLPTGTQEVQVEVWQIIGGSQSDDSLPGVTSGWSNVIMPTDVSYGSEILLNHNFSDSSVWTFRDGTWISPGVVHFNASSANFPSQSVTLEIGATYRFIAIGNKTGDNTSGKMRVNLSSGGTDYVIVSAAMPLGAFTIAQNFVSDKAATVFSIEADTSTFAGDTYSFSLRKIL